MANTISPAFGEDFVINFVDPLMIGNGIAVNPYFPLVQGNSWTYEGTSVDDDGEAVTETITVTVTGATKLIEGITCLVVNDVAVEDGEVIEDTDDWYATTLPGGEYTLRLVVHDLAGLQSPPVEIRIILDDADVIAGNGVGGLEIVNVLQDQDRGVSQFLCQVSGGGLMAGHALAIAHGFPQAKVVGVEPEGAEEQEAARTIADRLGGLPLALELAGACLRNLNTNSSWTWRRIGCVPTPAA